jgi:hypothetical protein
MITIAFFCVIIAAYRVWKKEREAAIEQNRVADQARAELSAILNEKGRERANLRVGNLSPDGERFQQSTALLWYIPIHNDGPSSAINPAVFLTNVSPKPTDSHWKGRDRYRLVPRGSSLDAANHPINKGDLQEFVFALVSGDHERRLYPGQSEQDNFALKNGDRFILELTASASNADALIFSYALSVENDRVAITRIS